MNGFANLLAFGLRRRIKDFFIITYSIGYPLVMILLLGYISTNFFKGDSSVTSFQYYTLVLIPFTIFCSIITMAYVAKDESLYKTAYRFIIAPVSSKSIVLSKIISCTVVVWLCNMLLLIITKLLLGTHLGISAGAILFLLLAESLMASAVGIYLGLAFRNFKTLKGILNIPINIFALLGGVFFPVGALGPTFEKVSYISPLTWINRGIIAAIYDNNSTILQYATVITLIIGIVFTVLAVTAFKKEAFME
ncbi:MAG: ABC transporter permease [Bacillota bacterium]|nr:ABC transporter permease [Bacillota bacterium]